MAEMLPPVSPTRIVVAGDVMVDRYWFGEAARISQEAPVPVVDVVAAEDRPGGAANVALNVVAMGARCTLVGAVGADAAARAMRATLEAAGVVCDLVEVPGWETTRKLRVVSQRQQLLRADFEEPLPEGVGAEVAARVEDRVGAADVLVIEDYDKGAVDRPEALVAAARHAGAIVVVDPKHKDFARYAGAGVLKPNRAEFERAAGGWSDEADFAERALAEVRRADVEALVVTRGGEGSTVIDRDGRVRHLPASDVEVYDRTGAGDTVAAALAVGLGLGWDTVASARVANLAAGLVCARMGTSAVTAPEINQAIAAAERPDEGVLTREQLLAAVGLARGRGEKIVFTNGCFDVLHAGHVGYLEEARELGDRLVVAVNDDASAGRLKGPGRPVNALERRMRVLEGLSAVDWVTPFSEDTPEALLEAVRPDVLVKGGDYAESAVVGAELVRSWGGEVRVLSLLPDCSTTSIVDRIKSA